MTPHPPSEAVMSMMPRHTQPGNSKLRMACSACCLVMRSEKSSSMATAPPGLLFTGEPSGSQAADPLRPPARCTRLVHDGTCSSRSIPRWVWSGCQIARSCCPPATLTGMLARGCGCSCRRVACLSLVCTASPRIPRRIGRNCVRIRVRMCGRPLVAYGRSRNHGRGRVISCER